MEEKEHAFAQYMNCTKAMEEVENCIGCICVQCSNVNAVGYSVMTEWADNEVKVRQWFDKKPFSGSLPRTNVVRRSCANSAFYLSVHCTKQRFYINRCFAPVGEVVADIRG